MPRYRRVFVPGGTYFFTVNANRRRQLFAEEVARACLRRAWRETKARYPFTLVAFCLMPDHLHCVWEMPDGDADFPSRWRMIKGLFSRYYLKQGGSEPPRSVRRKGKRETALWQERLWEHLIRDERDLARHVDYTHYNPVKHGFVNALSLWPWSTFHRFVRQGAYPPDWGRSAPDSIEGLESTGEHAKISQGGGARAD